MASHPAQVRTERDKRIAVRAALAGVRLDPKQLKIVLSAHDALVRKSNALMTAYGEAFGRAGDSADNHVLTTVSRRLDQLDSQMQPLDNRAAELRAHPQVRALILAREAAEARKS
jgi:hypothetical protein